MLPVNEYCVLLLVAVVGLICDPAMWMNMRVIDRGYVLEVELYCWTCTIMMESRVCVPVLALVLTEFRIDVVRLWLERGLHERWFACSSSDLFFFKKNHLLIFFY